MWFIQLVHFHNRDILSFVLTPNDRLYNDLTTREMNIYILRNYPDYEIETIVRIAGWQGEKKVGKL